MSRRILLATTFILLIIPYCAFASQTKAPNLQDLPSISKFLSKNGYTQIPIIYKKEALYIKGKTRNQVVYFLLDTGSVGSSILSADVKALKLNSIQSDEKFANMTGGTKLAKKVTLPKVEVGGIQAGDISAVITEQPFKNELPTIIVGNEFFAKFNVILDIGGGSLYLNKQMVTKRNWQKLNKLLTTLNYQKILLTELDSGYYTLPIQINNALPAYFYLIPEPAIPRYRFPTCII